MNSGTTTVRFLIHPILVHFPIAFLVLEFLLLFLWVFKQDDFFRRSSFLVFRFGYVAMLCAMVAGYWDANGITSIVRKHFISAAVTALFYTARGFLWLRMERAQKYNASILTASALIGCLFLIITGYLGGLLVYS